MPRLSPDALPKYRKHRASGQAIVTLFGRDCYLGPYGSKASRAEYDRLIGEWLARGRPTTGTTAQTEITVNEVMVAYWRHARVHYVKGGRPTTQQGLIRLALKPVKALYGKRPAVEFGPLSFKAVRQTFVDAGMTRKTVNGFVDSIRLMFKWAASEELIPESVHRALTTVAGLRQGKTEAPDRPPVQPVPDSDVEATLPHVPPIVADMVRLQRLTGMRPTEVCTIRPGDIDRSRDVWRYAPESHKTEHHGRSRTIFLGPKAQTIVTPYLNRPANAHCFDPRESEAVRLAERSRRRRTPLSCGNRPGTNDTGRRRAKMTGRYDKNSYRRAVQRGCLKANIPMWSPNQLRHAAATDIRRTYGLEAAQVSLGHSTADVTQVYAERDAAKAEQVARELG